MTDVNKINVDDVADVDIIVIDGFPPSPSDVDDVDDVDDSPPLDVDDCPPSVKQESFVTAQDLQSLISVSSIDEASKLLNLATMDDIDIPTMLKLFEDKIHASIDNHTTRMLKPLTEAKNILLRSEIEKMIERDGKFDLAGMIPFAEACISCKGTGEIYKFFRVAETIPCKFCTNGDPEDDGYLFIPCRICKGSKAYKGEECTRCYRDPETDLPTGKERVKCRTCRGKAIFRKLVIDSKIKSTTHCRYCKGRGFTLPEPPPPAKTKKLSNSNKPRMVISKLENPVISADLGKQLKRANIKE